MNNLTKYGVGMALSALLVVGCGKKDGTKETKSDQAVAPAMTFDGCTNFLKDCKDNKNDKACKPSANVTASDADGSVGQDGDNDHSNVVKGESKPHKHEGGEAGKSDKDKPASEDKPKEEGKDKPAGEVDKSVTPSAVDATGSKGESKEEGKDKPAGEDKPKEEGKDKPAGEVDKSVAPSAEEGTGSNDKTTDEDKDKTAGDSTPESGNGDAGEDGDPDV